MPTYGEGSVVTATDGSGRKKILKGGKWVDFNPAIGGAVATLATPDKKVINDLNEAAAKAMETKKIYDEVVPAIRRFQTGPFRAAFVDASVPNEADNALVRTGKGLLGALTRATGAVSDQDINDYQTIMRAKNIGVLEEQTRQKGVQTEGDAARMAMAGISPFKRVPNNLQVYQDASAKLDRQIGRAPFYARWAARYGSPTAPDEQGRSVEQAYQQSLAAHPAPPPPAAAPRRFKLLKD